MMLEWRIIIIIINLCVNSDYKNEGLFLFFANCKISTNITRYGMETGGIFPQFKPMHSD